MNKTIDLKSEEFKVEMEKTKIFADKVCENMNWKYGPDTNVNDGVLIGLARHRLLYKKRFCPCFMVEEIESSNSSKPKYKSVDNRICPCKPAIETEMKNDGRCHCQLFYVNAD